MDHDHGSLAIHGTPFYPRTSLLNERQNWTAWDRYHIVDAYVDWRSELKKIRTAAAVLDMSPLAKHYITGPDAERFVDYLIPRDATKLDVGQVYFSPWCNDGGVQVGDGIVMRLETDRFMFSADRMMRWFERNGPGFDVEFEDVTDDFRILSLQGPRSRDVLESATDESWSDLRFSRLGRTTIDGIDVLLSRQGFTGEMGYELWVPRSGGTAVWDALFTAGSAFGLQAAGLHAADVARIEAGMVIPGYDYTPAAIDPVGSHIPTSLEHCTTPLELSMGRFVDFDKDSDFLGKAALTEESRSGSKRKMVGIVMSWPEIVAAYADAALLPEVAPHTVRAPMPIARDGRVIGRTSSVTWSPTLGQIIGFAHVDAALAAAGTPVTVEWSTSDFGALVINARLSDLPHYTPRRATDPS
ncbi:MAG: aminomethyl transferase family protein [Acidimicrobiia bacterium]|nr:aminomethyl transferase family protein [Acidimicrobiia bacterium]